MPQPNGSRFPEARATLTGASAGVVFGMQDALTRHTLHTLSAQHLTGLLASWPLYVLAAVGVTGLWLMQSAFSTAPLHASLPAITAGEPVTGMALGIVIFGDPMPTWPGQVLLLAAGLAALVAGVILVARGPALSAGCIAEPAPAASRGQPGIPAAMHSRAPSVRRGDAAPQADRPESSAARVHAGTQQAPGEAHQAPRRGQPR